MISRMNIIIYNLLYIIMHVAQHNSYCRIAKKTSDRQIDNIQQPGNIMFFDNAAPDSCCAEHPLHIPTYPRSVSTAATVREKTCGQTVRQTHTLTDRPTDRVPTHRPTTTTCIYMYFKARINHSISDDVIACLFRVHVLRVARIARGQGLVTPARGYLYI